MRWPHTGTRGRRTADRYLKADHVAGSTSVGDHDPGPGTSGGQKRYPVNTPDLKKNWARATSAFRNKCWRSPQNAHLSTLQPFIWLTRPNAALTRIMVISRAGSPEPTVHTQRTTRLT
jgi:hypothetical protein